MAEATCKISKVYPCEMHDRPISISERFFPRRIFSSRTGFAQPMKSPYTVTHGWMQRTATAAFALLIGLALVAQDADARRLGGGGSFGRQSPNVTRQAAPPTNAAPAKPAPAPQAAPQSA